MNLSIAGRELVTLNGDGVSFRGTFHKPLDPASGALLPEGTRGRTGIVFFNSLSLPRSASGDAAVYWAEAFAQCGYPSFRFDLPGLGDSPGDIPAELLNFINSGGYAQVAASKMKELVARFELSGVIFVGHCAGGVTTVEASVLCRAQCEGLILLDPYFHLPQAIRPKMRRKLSDWALQSRLGDRLSNIFYRLKKLRLRFRGNALPQNANLPLLKCWKELAASRLPVLVLKAPARKTSAAGPRPGEFDYLRHLLGNKGSRHKVSVQFVDGTNHAFANRKGRLAVRLLCERWLCDHFPPAEPNDVWVGASRNSDSHNEKSSNAQLHCMEG
jgi:pimeloyl-ACP methyl ester carboxylesterase